MVLHAFQSGTGHEMQYASRSYAFDLPLVNHGSIKSANILYESFFCHYSLSIVLSTSLECHPAADSARFFGGWDVRLPQYQAKSSSKHAVGGHIEWHWLTLGPVLQGKSYQLQEVGKVGTLYRL